LVADCYLDADRLSASGVIGVSQSQTKEVAKSDAVPFKTAQTAF
jgi:hypothetical protein